MSFFVAVAGFLAINSRADQPIEVGTVEWGRDHDAALAASKASGKPVFLLFQEVPGCAGCKQFGWDELSNELVREAIESEFVPLMIPNNQNGEAAGWL